MIEKLTKLMQELDCPDCWMTTEERARTALDDYFAQNRKLALVFDGSRAAVLLLKWAQKSGCDIKLYGAAKARETALQHNAPFAELELCRDKEELYSKARKAALADGYELLADSACAGEEDMSAAIKLGVRSPLFLCRVGEAEVFILLKKDNII